MEQEKFTKEKMNNTFERLKASLKEGTCTLQNLKGAYARRGTPDSITLEQYIDLVTMYAEEKEKREKVLEEEKGIDVLSGCFNRFGWNKKLPKLIESLNRRSNLSFHSVLAIGLDVDRFKLINETYCHPVGDQAIRAAAMRLQEAVKEFGGDLVFRTGEHGDEFRIVLLIRKDLNDEELDLIFRRIQIKINTGLVVRDMDKDDQGSLKNSFNPFNMTMAMGYAVLKRDTSVQIDKEILIRDLMEKADKSQGEDKKEEIKRARMEMAGSDKI
jgi:diguanylate cyclase (GGDEF)-like protein